MIYLRAKGGEELPVFLTRAIVLASQADDVVYARYRGVVITVHKTWVDTLVAFYNEKRAHFVQQKRPIEDE
jgi:hypothetical protein